LRSYEETARIGDLMHAFRLSGCAMISCFSDDHHFRFSPTSGTKTGSRPKALNRRVLKGAGSDIPLSTENATKILKTAPDHCRTDEFKV